MEATEARNIAENMLSYEDGNAYTEIMIQIDLKARNGDFHIWYYDLISGRVRNKLRELGYSIEETTHRNETNIKISW